MTPIVKGHIPYYYQNTWGWWEMDTKENNMEIQKTETPSGVYEEVQGKY